MSGEIATLEKKKFEIFKTDTEKLGNLTAEYIEQFYPSYVMDNDSVRQLDKEDSYELLKGFTFYRICECMIYNIEEKFSFFAEKMQKLFTTAYSINQTVCYGIVSSKTGVSLVLGIDPTSNDEIILSILEGLLPGIRFEKYNNKFVNEKEAVGSDEPLRDKDRYVGCISGVPSLKIDGVYQNKDLSPLIRSLNGHNYTILVLCKPISKGDIQAKINEAIQIQDECFAISKRTLSLQEGRSKGDTHTDGHSDTDSRSTSRTNGSSVAGTIPGAAAGVAAGAVVGSIVPGLGTVVGAIGGGLIGLIAGKQVSFSRSKTTGTSHSETKSYSDAVTRTINSNKTIAGDVQNGFAIELMKMAEAMSNRLKIGRNIGMWESIVTFSSDSEIVSNIIQGSLYREIAASIPEVLPPVVFTYKDTCKGENASSDKIHNQQAIIPKGFFDKNSNTSPISSLVTSEEICSLCSIPTEHVVGFEIQETKDYSTNYGIKSDEKPIGLVCEFARPLDNVPFGLSEYDLNKHTFVCGITGGGKTNTVKQILEKIDKDFLVIEPAKKEYRNLKGVEVYTLGRPEINCLQINPFYIPMGISPQQHIDSLKDLFSASFALYGPMPYILEKCLYNIYRKKGWNLTLGFHPYLSVSQSREEMFSEDSFKASYKQESHKYVFPTMHDLKEEIDYYINNEMTYEGEVKGNIQAAIKARVDSLCVGSKGYMFNTVESLDDEKVLGGKVVLELEGLADDADKAFALGLLIILVNEYRQIKKELNEVKGLQHLLVIEEAHRLLKNVSTENNEDLGNPKGKAVEHFTNMLAEMRSYGQGVIVAEQIPSKLAPDVIKNSSNKIIHRIVAKDDQDAIANTIGVYPQDAIYLGNSKVGYALCHKEGMIQPLIVKINEVESTQNKKDIIFYQENENKKLFDINKSMLKNELSQDISVWATKTLVSLLYEPTENDIYNGLQNTYEIISHKLRILGMSWILQSEKRKECVLNCIIEEIISLLVHGVFSIRKLPVKDFIERLQDAITTPTKEKLSELQKSFEEFYQKKPEERAVEIVAGLISDDLVNCDDLSALVKDFTLMENAKLCDDVQEFLKRR